VRRAARSLILLVSLAATACSTSAATNGSTPTTLTVLAASSLSKVFPEIGSAFTRVNHGVSFSFSFAGTDQLAAQIQQGAPADVFAGASTKYGVQLAAAGSIEPYRAFCMNRLVLVVPASDPA